MSKCFSGVGNSRLLSERGPDGPCRKVLPKVICTKAVKNENKGLVIAPLGKRRHPTGTWSTAASLLKSTALNTVARKLNQSLRKDSHHIFEDLY